QGLISHSGPLGFDLTKSDVIYAASNTSPIRVEIDSHGPASLDTGHGLADGDQITITTAAGNTGANGTWTVTAKRISKFSIITYDPATTYKVTVNGQTVSVVGTVDANTTATAL